MKRVAIKYEIGSETKLYLGYSPRVWAMGAGHCAFIMLGAMYRIAIYTPSFSIDLLKMQRL